MIAALSELTLAALRWDPTIRGILFPAIMVVILCGSSYMIMATNIGNRLGFLVAVTALVGWMFLMSVAWLLYGIGLKGRANAWKVKEVVTGSALLDVAQYRPAALLKGATFVVADLCADAEAVKETNPAKAAKLIAGLERTAKLNRTGLARTLGWKPVCDGVPQRGDGQATVDAAIVRNADPSLTPLAIFAKSNQYQALGAYSRGGDNELFSIWRHKFYLRHSPHWFAIQVQPYRTETVKTPDLGKGRIQRKDDKGAPVFVEKTGSIVKNAKGDPVVDIAAPITTVLLERDLGSKRQPPFVLFVFSGLALAILASVLHRRDKQVMAAMGGKAPAKA